MQSAYRVRHKAATVNMAFVEELRKFEPKPSMAELFKEVVCDLYKDDKHTEQDEKKNLTSQVTDNNNRVTKTIELL